MIRVSLYLDDKGTVRSLRADGHADGYVQGKNPVCAAATMLLRTYLRWVENGGEERVTGDAPEPGNLYAEIGEAKGDRVLLHRGAAELLITGLSDLEETFPQQCSLRVKRFKE